MVPHDTKDAARGTAPLKVWPETKERYSSFAAKLNTSLVKIANAAADVWERLSDEDKVKALLHTAREKRQRRHRKTNPA